MTTSIERTGFQITKEDKRFVGWHMLVAVASLLVGSLFGPLQVLEFSGVDWYQYIEPLFESYYQGLTIHGVLNALVWTTFFIVGFTNLVVSKGLERPTSETQSDRVLGHARWPGHDCRAAATRRGNRSLHLLRTAEGQLGLLRRPHPGGGR